MRDPGVYEWISATPPNSMDQLEHLWRSQENHLSPNQAEAWLNWAVKRISDGAYVGKLDAAVNTLKIATNVGYVFFPAYWGNGYASEAVTAVTDHFVECGVSRMVATVTEGNPASYRVLEKAGFARSRAIPDNDTIRGIKFNDVEYIRSVAGRTTDN